MSISLKIFLVVLCHYSIYTCCFFMNSYFFSVCVYIYIFSKSNADAFFSRLLASFDAR